MKLKKDLILRQIAGQYMVMPVGRLSQICQLLHISSSAAFIWKVMEKGEFTEDSLVEEALKEYPGTILFISHDRYFINEIAKKILYIENNGIKEYLGNYDDYINKSKI